MPHVEMKYSADVQLDAQALFSAIERAINELDPSCGVCKSRAYPTTTFRHSHVMIDVWLLQKPHRDEVFNHALLGILRDCVQKQLAGSIFVSVQLYYRDGNYVTIE